MGRLTIVWATLVLTACACGQAKVQTPGLKFEVSVAPGLWPKAEPARVLVVLGKRPRPEPRDSIGDTGMTVAPVLGADAVHKPDGVIATLDSECPIFPIESLAKLPVGDYYAQAVLHRNYDLNFPNAPGDLYSEPVKVELNFMLGGTTKLKLTKSEPAESMPADTANIKYLKRESKLLSEFHGRPMYLRAAVVLPAGHDSEPDRKYPLRVHIGGYGTRFTAARAMIRPGAMSDSPKFISLVLDGAGPHGDPYQVNSANNGPYGDALTKELIPYVEEKYRGIGNGSARFTDGHSTGGWVSLALQVFYPDFFNGCWSFAPDPVDFRAYELIDIYRDTNAYVNRHGFERPAKRQRNGDTVYTARHECQIENVLGLGNNWVTSGKDWGAWNATFGPKGKDGRPIPLWNPVTGVIDRSVTDHWKKYDLRRVIETNWSTLAPKLRGKLHIYVGDADDYFLNNAVRLLKDSLDQLNPPADAEITIGPAAGHGFHPLSERQTLDAMQKAMDGKRGAK